MATSSGVEALPGESEAAYVARQTRLRDEATERMRAKFGASGGLNGRMGGCGPSGFGSNTGGGGGGGGFDLLSSLSSAASIFGSSAVAALGTAAEVASTGASAAAMAVSAQLERVNQGSAGIDRSPQRSCSSDSDLSDLLTRGYSMENNAGSRSSGAHASTESLGGVEALPGETDTQYAARQARLREAASARMRVKFGSSGGLNGRMGGCGPGSVTSSSVGSGDDLATMLNGASLDAPQRKPDFVPPKSSTHSAAIVGAGKVKKVAACKSNDNWDDFEDDW